MATPGELVRSVSKILRVPEPTVVEHDRQLAKAGLRRKGGRGSSAAIMGARDAANLVISLCTAEPISKAARFVDWYRELQATALPKQKPLFGLSVDRDFTNCRSDCWADECPFSELRALGSEHSFGDALELLIPALRGFHQNNTDPALIVEINFYRPLPGARIYILNVAYGGLYQQEIAYRPIGIPDFGDSAEMEEQRRHAKRKYGSQCEIHSRVTVYDGPLRSIGDALIDRPRSPKKAKAAS